MRAVCPRCGDQVHAPTVWSSAWRCDLHGDIHPLRLASTPTRVALDGLVKSAQVPVWMPWPLPYGWLVTGFSGAGDERTGTRAAAMALSGPNPVGGPADLLVVAEEPGVGLGAGLAGLTGPDPGAGFATGPPHASVRVGNREAQLWLVEPDGMQGASASTAGMPRGVRGVAHPGEGCAAYAGEYGGGWVWVVLWPDSAGIMLYEALALRDLRDTEPQWDVPFGALTTRLPA